MAKTFHHSKKSLLSEVRPHKALGECLLSRLPQTALSCLTLVPRFPIGWQLDSLGRAITSRKRAVVRTAGHGKFVPELLI